MEMRKMSAVDLLVCRNKEKANVIKAVTLQKQSTQFTYSETDNRAAFETLNVTESLLLLLS